MTPHERITVLLVLLIAMLAFAVAGRGDYADALAQENAMLRAQVQRCAMGGERP